MFKKMLILTVAIFFIAPFLVSAEMAPQFNKSANDTTDLSTAAPKHEKLLKGGEVMESKAATKGGEVMENNAAIEPGEVMENNVATEPGQVMENNAAMKKLNQNQSVME